jgi:hypothetical protein
MQRFYGGSDEAPPFANGFDVPATTTGEDGTYRIVGLPEGIEFFVLARAGAHWKKARGPIQPAPIEAGMRADLSVQQAGAIEVQIGASSKIVACLLEAVARDHGSRPRLIRTFSGSTETLEALQPGVWQVRADVSGRAIRPVDVEVVAGETAIVQIALP